jgi:hypothetical protein
MISGPSIYVAPAPEQIHPPRYLNEVWGVAGSQVFK